MGASSLQFLETNIFVLHFSLISFRMFRPFRIYDVN